MRGSEFQKGSEESVIRTEQIKVLCAGMFMR